MIQSRTGGYRLHGAGCEEDNDPSVDDKGWTLMSIPLHLQTADGDDENDLIITSGRPEI